eukprot:TRINITY_DN22640_c0_g1_i5.p1 TRINITY_DN22640_c0_g1~~TRINITY_DN22640_c0_g1_i5.p1  ORF type:complete len:363 (-),score=55.24 TRINITY_DN22640_c0_g1_i5:206-1246(-)
MAFFSISTFSSPSKVLSHKQILPQGCCSKFCQVLARPGAVRRSSHQLKRVSKLIVNAGAASPSYEKREYQWDLSDSLKVSPFNANVRLLTYAGMQSGYLQVQGAEQASKALFDTCLEICEFSDSSSESTSLQVLSALREQVQKLQENSDFKEEAVELENALNFAKTGIVSIENVDTKLESVEDFSPKKPDTRYISEQQRAVITGIKVAMFLSKMGGALKAQEYEQEAEWLFDNVQQMEQKILQQKDMYMLSNPVHEVVKMLLRREEDEDVGKIAKSLYAGAIEFWDNSFGPNHPDMSTLYVGLAETILDLGEIDTHQYNVQDRIQHLAEYIQQKHQGTGTVPEYYI